MQGCDGEEVLRCAQDFGSGLRRPLNASTFGSSLNFIRNSL